MTLGIDQVPAESFAFLGAAVLCMLAAVLFAMRPYRRAARHRDFYADDGRESVPKASVVMYCQSDRETLMATLSALASQDYPDFEVVVVCDAGMEYAGYISELVEARWTNVYVTFLQPGSHNLSRRKLANTIGMKAAKGEVVVTTQANIVIPSDSWLSAMMAPFCGAEGRHVDVTLGISHMDLSNMSGPAKAFRRFDALLSDALWIGYAAAGKPYRGDMFNLALRRSLFFKHKGYSGNMYLVNGEDDVYLREVCTPANTRLVTSPDAVLVTEWDDAVRRVWTMRKASYMFTRRWLPSAPFFKAGMAGLMQWLVPGFAVAAALTGLPSVWPLVAACLPVAALWIADIVCFRNVAALFGINGVAAPAPLLWLWRPVANLFFRMAHSGSYKKNFTWQR